MGIRKKVALGFTCLAVLLIGAGTVSFFELNRIGKRTQQILEIGNRNMALSRELLDGAEMQHLSLLHNYNTDVAVSDYDSLYLTGRKMMIDALEKGDESGIAAMNDIKKAFEKYETISRAYLSKEEYYESDWLKTSYWRAYLDMTTAIKEYMTGSEYNLGVQASIIEQGAYRAVTPSLVTIAVLLLLLLLLLYFVDFYFMKPVVKMNKGIEGWLKFRSPFSVPTEGKDETLELGNNIDKLIELARKGDGKSQ